MSSEIAKSHLEEFDLEDRIQEFEVSSVTVELAAQAASCESVRIAKTLSFLVDSRAVLIVAVGDAKMDNPRYKNEFHMKAKILTPDEVTKLVGHSVGGVCPLDVKEGVRILPDGSLKQSETVHPACGNTDSTVGLTVAELEQCSGFEGWIDVCRVWREGEQQQINVRKKVLTLGRILLYDRQQRRVAGG